MDRKINQVVAIALSEVVVHQFARCDTERFRLSPERQLGQRLVIHAAVGAWQQRKQCESDLLKALNHEVCQRRYG